MTRSSPARDARIAGLLYVFVVAASSYALFSTSSLIVSGDAAATAVNIRSSEAAFRLAFSANLLSAAAYVAVVAILFALFEPVSRTWSAVAAFFGLAGCAMSGAGMVNQLGALHYLGDQGALAAFGPGAVEALARAHLRLGGLANSINLVFFGFYCVTLGALVLGARFMPRFFGVLLIIGGLAWLAGSLSQFLKLPVAGEASSYFMGVGAFGEIAFTLWISVMGVNSRKWREQAAAGQAA
jgi:hypothetical protein